MGGARGQRIGEAKNPGPRVGRCSSVLDSDSDVPLVSRGRFSILSTESDNDEEGAAMAVAAGCAGDCDRVAVRTEDFGRRRKRLRVSQATTVANPPESFFGFDPARRVLERHTIFGEKCTSPHKAVDFGGRVRPASTLYVEEQSTTSGAETSEVASEFEGPTSPPISHGLGLNSWTGGICQSCFRTGPL